MNRSPLVLLGAAVAILGYAVLYNGLSILAPASFPAIGFMASLTPGSLPSGAPLVPDNTGGSTAGNPGQPRSGHRGTKPPKVGTKGGKT